MQQKHSQPQTNATSETIESIRYLCDFITDRVLYAADRISELTLGDIAYFIKITGLSLAVLAGIWGWMVVAAL